MNQTLPRLNTEQTEAATCGDGPCLVLAGPGTGKTTTLASRFAYLVSRGVDPSRIMAVTFTRKAADQLKERIGLSGAGMSIGTFHSLAGRILRTHAELADRTSDFVILDENKQRGLLFDLKIFWRADDGGELTDIIAGAKEQLMTPDEFERDVIDLCRKKVIPRGHYLFQAARHFHAYEQALTDADACDFSDLIAKTVRILENHELIRNIEAARFDHLLIDEFQDVNPAQIRLIDALLCSHDNLWAVGDDDQSIYGFRNADIGQTLDFTQKYRGATVHQLCDNYRSTAQILLPANNLIRMNRQRHNKTLNATRPDGPAIVLNGFETSQLEADWVAGAVEKVLKRGIPVSEVAVLFRVGHISASLQVAFSRKNIPFVLRGAKDFWHSAEVGSFVGMLRLALNKDDPEGRYLLRTGKRAERLGRRVSSAPKSSFATLVNWARNEVIDEVPSNATAERCAAWEEHVRTAAAVAAQAGSLDAFLVEIQVQSQALQHKEGLAVVLSTIHSAKGLEWHTVFLAGFEDSIIPHELAEDEEEERRLAYVAMTRSKRFLSISFCTFRHQGDMDPSPFIAEALNGLDQTAYDWRCTSMAPPVMGARTRKSPVAFVPTFGYDRGRVESNEVSRRSRNRENNRPERTGLRWTARDDEQLQKGFLERKSLEELARKLKRSIGATAGRMSKLGLLENGYSDERYECYLDPESYCRQKEEELTRKAEETLGPSIAARWLEEPHEDLEMLTPLQACCEPRNKRILQELLEEAE